MRLLSWFWLFTCAVSLAAGPRIAVFPIGGDAPEALRERAAFSLRAKLDRTGKFEVVDGPRMLEVTGDTKITLQTPRQELQELARLVEGDIIIWGEFQGTGLKVSLLDLRQPAGRIEQLSESVKEPTDLRFAVENILQRIEGVAAFERPVEQSVWEDDLSRRLWQEGTNLVSNGDFAKAGAWVGIYRSELYPVALSTQMPPVDKVAIVQGAGAAGQANHALALNLSRECAETNGLAALSDEFKIEPNTRYRISFKYKSAGPRLHVFVKGYTAYKSPTGQMAMREIYRRQVPPSGATDGQWVTIVDDFNPQHISLTVQTLRIDLYAYLSPGTVLFDDIIVKAVGQPTRQAKDAAIKPATRK